MAMNGTISTQFTINGITVSKKIPWSATKKLSDGTVTITCHYEHSTLTGHFFALGGKCTFTINGVDYSVSTNVTDAYDTVFTTPSVTSNPIPITAVDDVTRIAISAKWEPSGSIGYYSSRQSLTASFRQSDGSHAGYAYIDPLYTSTEIVLNGTEITEQSTVDVVNNRTHSGVTHSLTYTVGGDTETLFTEQSGDYLNFTLPETLAERIPKTNELLVKFTLTTHFPWGVSGSKTKTITYSLPDKEIFKPSFTIEVKDGESLDNVCLADRYGGYVQGYSRLKIKITPVLAYGSAIALCTINANGETFIDEYEVETALLKNSGEQNFTVTLVDERGRSGGEKSFSFNVLEYVKPTVSDLSISRCDRIGNADSSGDYIKVTFNANVTPLKNINSASYKLKYQTSAGLDQNDIDLTDYDGQYSIVNGTYIFPADAGKVYSVTLTAIDDLDEGFNHTGTSDTITIFNILASGFGFAFGTIASLENVLESAFKFFPSGGFMFPKFEGTTITTILTPNIYTVESGKDVGGSPTDGEYTLIVLPGGGEGDLLFIAISNEPEVYIKRLANSSWSSWFKFGITEVE